MLCNDTDVKHFAMKHIVIEQRA